VFIVVVVVIDCLKKSIWVVIFPLIVAAALLFVDQRLMEPWLLPDGV